MFIVLSAKCLQIIVVCSMCSLKRKMDGVTQGL
ncbi:hypothetical protein MTR67_051666 [Solanum verrucosum]|uniref:Uncharacterized protein n=1 Tax=Solanum verrucosum TaxID=315347 RepID=A0AAF0V7Q7_SOLVR|nr:hypothetical protein MTR67_051666 [Solanum verrucosum]